MRRERERERERMDAHKRTVLRAHAHSPDSGWLLRLSPGKHSGDTNTLPLLSLFFTLVFFSPPNEHLGGSFRSDVFSPTRSFVLYESQSK